MMASSNGIDCVQIGFGFRFGGTDLATGAEPRLSTASIPAPAGAGTPPGYSAINGIPPLEPA
jgi:hypothetical protein